MALKILADNAELAASLCSTFNLSIHGFFSDDTTKLKQVKNQFKIPKMEF